MAKCSEIRGEYPESYLVASCSVGWRHSRLDDWAFRLIRRVAYQAELRSIPMLVEKPPGGHWRSAAKLAEAPDATLRVETSLGEIQMVSKLAWMGEEPGDSWRETSHIRRPLPSWLLLR